MRKKRMVAGKDWEFDGTAITVHIPMKWKRRGGRKLIIAPDGSDAWVPTKPRPDETLIRALARAHRWKRMLEEGAYRSAGEIAEREGNHPQLRKPAAAADAPHARYCRSRPRRSPVEGLQLTELTTAAPSAWEEQRQRLLAK